MHCIIAYAASAQLAAHVLDDLELPRLNALLRRLRLVDQAHDPLHAQPPAAMPHERALARALGWDAHGPLPWAAWAMQQAGSPALSHAPQAWITPCHWQIGMDQAFMLNPAQLQLRDEESQALMHAMQPYLQADGLTLRWHDALHWHVQGAPLQNWLQSWQAPSIDRAIHANVRPWIGSDLPPAWARLHSEMQMLAYNHPVNDARLARGQQAINAFWLHGAGSLPSAATPSTTVLYATDLRESALAGDGAAWRSAWQALDARLPAPDGADAPNWAPLRLTLCSETAAHQWASGSNSWWSRLHARLRPIHPTAALQALMTP